MPTSLSCRIDAGIAQVINDLSNPPRSDLKSRARKGACGFDPRLRHHISHLDTASYHFPPSLLLLSPSGKLGALHALLSELCAVLLIPSRGRNEYCPDAGLSTLWNLVSQEGSEAWTA